MMATHFTAAMIVLAFLIFMVLVIRHSARAALFVIRRCGRRKEVQLFRDGLAGGGILHGGSSFARRAPGVERGEAGGTLSKLIIKYCQESERTGGSAISMPRASKFSRSRPGRHECGLTHGTGASTDGGSGRFDATTFGV